MPDNTASASKGNGPEGLGDSIPAPTRLQGEDTASPSPMFDFGTIHSVLDAGHRADWPLAAEGTNALAALKRLRTRYEQMERAARQHYDGVFEGWYEEERPSFEDWLRGAGPHV
jgi:hypothetical protein